MDLPACWASSWVLTIFNLMFIISAREEPPRILPTSANSENVIGLGPSIMPEGDDKCRQVFGRWLEPLRSSKEDIRKRLPRRS